MGLVASSWVSGDAVAGEVDAFKEPVLSVVLSAGVPVHPAKSKINGIDESDLFAIRVR